jgi:DNA-binding NtrC family response regulator
LSSPLDASVVERAELLRGFGIWAALSEPALHATAAAMQPAAFAAGECIIRHGEPGRYLHVLTKGEAEVRVHAGNGAVMTVSTLSAGACVGEMSLLSGDVTSADVVATGACDTLALDRRSFEALVAQQPQLLREFVRMVSRRLKDSNAAVGAAREKEKGLTRFLQDARAEQYGELVGKLQATREMLRRIDALAPLGGPVLIQGERGTGKELAARLIHFRGPRREAPLLCTDCSQIAETPWGDKLFGDYRRAPADLGPAPVSYLDLAGGGTIVLKNIDALPRAIQDRLAEFIAAETQATPANGTTVRIIATCRGDFQELASAQRVSPGLARALEGGVLAIPALRDRKRDIPELAAHFARKHAQRLGKPVPVLDGQSVGKLVTFDYRHANVNELEEAIRRAVILTDGDRIEAEAIFLGQPPAPSRWALNLLPPSRPGAGHTLRRSLLAARVAVLAAVALVVYEGLFAAAGSSGNTATFLVWTVGWPMLVLSFFFAGRACCSVCPMPMVGEAGRRAFNLKWRVPAWLKQHDAAIVMAGFFLIIWAEEVTGMRHSARATALLLLSILAGAAVTAVLLPRRTWCRHLCPMGAFAGVGALTGVVELRPTPDICSAKCRDHACFKGSEHAEGCPLFNHVMFVDSNRHCVLCLQCLESCPHDSPQLNLRLPALDLLTAGNRPDVGRWTVLLAGLLAALVLILHWERQDGGVMARLLHEHRLLAVSALLALGAVVPQLGLHLLARRLGPSPDPEAARQFWGKVTAWMPAVIAGFASYQFEFVTALEGAHVTLGTRLEAGQAAQGVSVTLLALVQGGILFAGLLVTAGLLWNLGRASARYSAPSSANT